jgi:hypothetical protein
MVPLEPLPNPDENSRMQKFVHETFRPEVWGRVHHSEIHHLFEQHMLSKSQRKTRPTLQIISMSPLLFVTNVVQHGKSRKGVFGLTTVVCPNLRWVCTLGSRSPLDA